MPADHMITSIQVGHLQQEPSHSAAVLKYFQEGVSISDGYFDQILSCDGLIKEDSEPSETGADYLQFLQVCLAVCHLDSLIL